MKCDSLLTDGQGLFFSSLSRKMLFAQVFPVFTHTTQNYRTWNPRPSFPGGGFDEATGNGFCRVIFFYDGCSSTLHTTAVLFHTFFSFARSMLHNFCFSVSTQLCLNLCSFTSVLVHTSPWCNVQYTKWTSFQGLPHAEIHTFGVWWSG